jgi:hypothetical protein
MASNEELATKEKKKKAYDLLIFQTFLNIISVNKSSLEKEELATLVDALIKANKFVYRRKLEKDHSNCDRCIEKLLNQSEQNDVEFLCILNERGYNFGTKSIIEMLEEWAVKNKEPLSKVLINALNESLLDPTDEMFVSHIRLKTDCDELVKSILLSLDNFDIIGSFLNNFIPENVESETKIQFVLEFFTEQNIQNIHGDIHEMVCNISAFDESDDLEAIKVDLGRRLIDKCNLDENGCVENTYLEEVSESGSNNSNDSDFDEEDDSVSDSSPESDDASDEDSGKKKNKKPSRTTKAKAPKTTTKVKGKGPAKKSRKLK